MNILTMMTSHRCDFILIVKRDFNKSINDWKNNTKTIDEPF